MEINKAVKIIITDMENGKVTGLILDEKHYTIDENPINEEQKAELIKIKLPTRKYIKTKRMENVVDKWIKKNKITKFSVKDFYRDNPKQYYRRKLIDNYISKMIDDKTLTQMSNDTFIVAQHKK